MAPAPPPDFRFVGVEPGPSAKSVRSTKLLVGAGAFVAGLVVAWRLDWVTFLVSLAVAGCSVLVAHRVIGPVLAGERLSEARMSIVPWGVLVHAEPEPRVLHWAAVREVRVESTYDMDHATPSTRWSVVRIRTERETLGGRAPGDVALESLEANVERYAEEASRPLALDLDGEHAMDELLEPTFERLLSEARWLLTSGELDERLALAPKSYRHVGSLPQAETRGALAEVLGRGLDSPADPRPLAALLAAELDERSLLHLVLPLTGSPHPLVAAVARASALRLGCDIKRVGALEELSEFVPAADLGQLRRWAEARRASAAAAS